MRSSQPRPNRARRQRRAFTPPLLAGLSGLAIAACGGSSHGSGSAAAGGGSTNARTSAASAATTGSGGSGSTGSGSGTLTVQFDGPPILGLDPADVAGAQSNIYMSLAYDSLTYAEPTGKLVPDLATSWSMSDDNKEMTLHLRKGVHFSDGSAMTAAGVAKWLKYFQTTKGIDNAELQQMTSATAAGPLTVHIKLSSPNPGLPNLLSQQYGAGMVASPKAMAKPGSMKNATDGAGAFKLDPSQTVANSTYTYVRNPRYWNPSAVHFNKVVVKVIQTGSSVEAAVAGGQVNVAEGDGSTVTQAKSSGLQVLSTPGNEWGMWILDRNGKTTKPLGSVQVRQALNYAIERPQIVKALNPNGYADPTAQMGVPEQAGFNPSLDTYYSYDPTKAKALLSQAGYPHGFTFTAMCTPLLNTCNLAQAIAQSLAKVGVTMKIDSESQIPVFSQKFSSGRVPVVVFNSGGPAFIDAQALVSQITYQNPYHSTNPAITSAFNALGAATTTAAATSANTKLIKAEAANGWFAPVERLDTIYYVKGVSNVQLHAGEPTYYNPVDPSGTYSWRPAK